MFREKSYTKEELKVIRKEKIRKNRKSLNLKIKDLSYMFHATEEEIEKLTEGIEVNYEREITIEGLDKLLESNKKILLAQGYTEEQFNSIYGIEILEKNRISESDINFGCYVEIERVKQEKEQQIKSLEKEKQELLERVADLVRRYIDIDEELYNQSLEIMSLELQNANLSREIERLKEKGPSCKKNRYTEEEKKRMVEVYNQYFRNPKKTLEVLHKEGIQVGYRYLLKIVKERT